MVYYFKVKVLQLTNKLLLHILYPNEYLKISICTNEGPSI